MKRPLFLALLAALGACGDGPTESQPPGTKFYVGRIDVRVDGRLLRLLGANGFLLELDERAFQVGVALEPDAMKSWDPWEIDKRGDADSGVEFRSPRAFHASRAGSAIDLDYGDGITARVTIAESSSTRATLTLASSSPNVVLTRIRAKTTGGPKEGFYGLGEQLDAVDNRGKLRAMQIESDGTIESANNEAHVPVPLLVGTQGWAMFVASTRIGTFDVARKDPDVIEATFADTSLRFDLFVAEAPLDLFAEYYAMTGSPRLPAPWAMGPFIWRNEDANQAEVEADIAKIRSLDLATSAIWIDRPYATAVNTFDFDGTRYSDPQAMITRAHAAGLRMGLWSTPYLEPAAGALADEAKTKGYFTVESGIPLNKWSLPIDFTNEAARAFWLGLVHRYTDMGIEGFKLDYGEDIVPSLGLKRNVWRFADGSDERTMHYGYSALYHRTYADALSGDPFLLVRAAHWGEQTTGCIVWPGDLDATFTKHREPVADGIGVGGLPASVIAGLSLASSGFPFFGADTGGYRHSPPDRELFIRWVEQTSLSTVMQTGDGSSQPPWVFTAENGRDDAALDVYRKYARLHLRLFPYEWTYANRMLRDGRPIVRPLGLAYPELGVHPADEYLFGDDLLVAPVVERGKTSRHIDLPPGTWRSFWDATPVTAGDVAAPLDVLPLFVRDGAMIPLLRPTVDTLSPATDPDVDSFWNDHGPLHVLVFPGPLRSFELWDGAKIASVSATEVECSAGKVFDRGFVLEIVGDGRQIEVPASGGRVAVR